MLEFTFGIMLGLAIGYPMGLFIESINRKIKNGGR
jgi:hypothetical protein